VKDEYEACRVDVNYVVEAHLENTGEQPLNTSQHQCTCRYVKDWYEPGRMLADCMHAPDERFSKST
jgi:hypothetical protein